MEDRIEEVDVTILETRKADVRRSIGIAEESGTDPEDEASRRVAAQIAACTREPIQTSRRATPITIISVGVNETTGRGGMESTRGRGGNASASPRAHVHRELVGLIGVD